MRLKEADGPKTSRPECEVGGGEAGQSGTGTGNARKVDYGSMQHLT